MTSLSGPQAPPSYHLRVTRPASHPSLTYLTRVRGGSALSLLAYLKKTADDADTLPSYFPDRMHDGSTGWFDVVRQKVRIKNRVPHVPSTASGVQSEGDEEPNGGGASGAPHHGDRDHEWGDAEVERWDRIVVFGEPGAGKSWLLRFDEHRLGLQWKVIDARTVALNQIILPIRVPLADVSHAAAAPAREPLTDADRVERVAAWLVSTVRDRATTMLSRDPTNFSGVARHCVEEDLVRFQGLVTPPASFDHVVRVALDEGRALVMLDAWDEVPASNDRDELVRHVRAFASAFKGRLVLTSREADFPLRHEASPIPHAVVVELRPLVRSQIEQFARSWFGEPDVVTGPHTVTASFIRQLDADRGQVFELARNPLMLTLMCRLYEDTRLSPPSAGESLAAQARRFPTHRVEIYARCINGLLRDWKKTWETRPGAGLPGDDYVGNVTDVLAHVAATLFTEHPPYRAPRVVGLVRAALQALARRRPGHALRSMTVDALVKAISDDGVLIATDDRHDAYRFLHRTFQEYFAGVELAGPAVDLAFATRLESAVSHLAHALGARRSDAEVVLLALGYVGLVNRELPDGVGRQVAGGAIQRLLDEAQPGERFDVLALMGRAVAELGVEGVGADAHERVTTEVRNALRGDGADLSESATPSSPDARSARLGDWMWPPGRWMWLPGLEHLTRLLFRRRLAAIRSEFQDSKHRVAFGNTLGRIGDTRFHGAERWYLPSDVACGWTREAPDDLWGFAWISGGAVLIGSDKRLDPEADDHELPQHSVDVGAFYVGRWPVTEQQFGWFVRSASYTGAGTKWGEWERGRPNHPVVWVSWHDAAAYCRWLTAEWQRERARLPLRLREAMDAGWTIGLPSEAEWEWVARRATGRIYPWGNAWDGGRVGRPYIKSENLHMGETIAVGCFPRGRTPADEGGVEDLVGNALWWTRSQMKGYPYLATDGREGLAGNEHRVVRGGSFSHYRARVRAAFRYSLAPEWRDHFVGFRVVLSPFRFWCSGL